MWYHPKYYEELRKKRKELERQAASNKHEEASSDKQQASSDKQQATEQQATSGVRFMKPGPWPTATSTKHQATSNKLRQIVARQNVALTDKPESGFKQQATSCRLQAIQKIFDVGKSLKLWFMLQASGYKVPDLCTFIKFWNVKRGIQN